MLCCLLAEACLLPSKLVVCQHFCVPALGQSRGLLDLFHVGTGSFFAFPDAAAFFRSTINLPYLAQTGMFCIVF